MLNKNSGNNSNTDPRPSSFQTRLTPLIYTVPYKKHWSQLFITVGFWHMVDFAKKL